LHLPTPPHTSTLSLHDALPISEQATQWALRAEHAALSYHPQISNSEGASIDSYEGHFVLGNSRGFLGGYPYSRHSISVSPIAGRSEEHTSELQSRFDLVCRLLL